MGVFENLSKVETLIKNGWMQGDFNDGAGNFCLIGAVDKAADYKWDATEDMKKFLKLAIAKRTHKTFEKANIVAYNDYSRRKKEQVLAVIKHAKKLCK